MLQIPCEFLKWTLDWTLFVSEILKVFGIILAFFLGVIYDRHKTKKAKEKKREELEDYLYKMIEDSQTRVNRQTSLIAKAEEKLKGGLLEKIVIDPTFSFSYITSIPNKDIYDSLYVDKIPHNEKTLHFTNISNSLTYLNVVPNLLENLNLEFDKLELIKERWNTSTSEVLKLCQDLTYPYPINKIEELQSIEDKFIFNLYTILYEFTSYKEGAEITVEETFDKLITPIRNLFSKHFTDIRAKGFINLYIEANKIKGVYSYKKDRTLDHMESIRHNIISAYVELKAGRQFFKDLKKS